MLRNILCSASCAALVFGSTACEPCAAAPRINNLSLRGLQAGGVTTLVIDGSELLPDPRIMLSAPTLKQTIKEGATPTRLEVEFALDGQVPGGIYLLRAASASGISEAAAIGIDALPQATFAEKTTAPSIAMTGALTGSTVLSTGFSGKQGDRVLVEVESRRLGSKLNPVVHIYDARGSQLAWSQGRSGLSGDARAMAVLPADGTYRIELHDALYRGENPGFFRLKMGQFAYADLVFPLAVKRGSSATFEFASTNLPAEARSTATWPAADFARAFEPAPWPAGAAMLSGSRPVVLSDDLVEMLEGPAGDKPQELPAAPIAVNGRIAKAAEQDRYRLAVAPGQTLRFDVLANRAHTALDAVLSIQNEQGAELAGGDDRPGSSDPLVDFKVPDAVKAIVVALRDLRGRGGAEFIYRLTITPVGAPSFDLALTEERYLVPKDGATLVRVRATRAGYNGPIKLSFPNLPTRVSITGDEIPTGASDALVTLSAPGLSPAQSLTGIFGTGTEANPPIKRPALMPEDTVNKHQPWLRDDVAIAVTTPTALGLVWDLFPSDVKFALGTALPVKLRVARAAGSTGAIRLTLLTTQITPRKRVKVNNQDREVDDVERTIRLEAATTIAADQNETAAKVLVPADLPQIAYDLAIQADLLDASGKNVVASAVTPARRMTATVPISLELADQGPVEVRAGLGPTGKLIGKINRVAGFSLPVNLTIAGLPKGIISPSFTVPGDQSQFEFPLVLPYGTAPGDVSGAKLAAASTVNAKDPTSIVRAAEIAVSLKIVPGDKPPAEKSLTIFEDQPQFVASLDQGSGQATLVTDQKYSGAASVKVTPDQRYNPSLPGLGVKIRERPQAGEFRYLRFAWKKQGGQAICLQLNHDGQWGPAAAGAAKFRYHAGPAGECFGASLALDANLPAEFTVVTRDLFADFGEFTLTGLALSPVDGEYALFDHIYLGVAPEDLDLVKP
jgi:hypothetical protein